MTKFHLTPLAETLPAAVPFVGPETQERAAGHGFAARMGANESMFGPAPSAINAMAQAAHDTWMYGDPEIHDLRQALADHHGVGLKNVIVGEGIDGLQGYLVRLFVTQGDSVVTSDGAYPTFNFHVAGYGGTLVKVPYNGDYEDPDALIAKAADVQAKLIYFANPDNPMGTWHDASTMQRMIDAVPDGSLLALDEAYIENAPDGTAPAIDVTDKRVVRMRTFSKSYGMAGLRVGYVIGHEDVIGAFHKVRNHFGMGRIAQAGALAALKDQDYLHKTVADIAAARDRIAAIARAAGLKPLPSATNFVTMDCGQDGDFARKVLAALVARGIFVRMPGVAPLDRCIRVSVGNKAANDAFEAALPLALAAARA